MVMFSVGILHEPSFQAVKAAFRPLRARGVEVEASARERAHGVDEAGR